MDDDPFAWTVENRLRRLEKSVQRIADFTDQSERYAKSARRWFNARIGLWILSMAALAVATLSVLNVH